MRRAVVAPMKGCACHDVTFAEIARRMGVEGLSFEALRRILPCGRTCTACLPDLAEYLRRRGLPLSS